jgi:hypothetical protein
VIYLKMIPQQKKKIMNIKTQLYVVIRTGQRFDE